MKKDNHWILEPGMMMCSKCGWAFDYQEGLEDEWKYCPNCGAKIVRFIYVD